MTVFTCVADEPPGQKEGKLTEKSQPKPEELFSPGSLGCQASKRNVTVLRRNEFSPEQINYYLRLPRRGSRRNIIVNVVKIQELLRPRSGAGDSPLRFAPPGRRGSRRWEFKINKVMLKFILSEWENKESKLFNGNNISPEQHIFSPLAGAGSSGGGSTRRSRELVIAKKLKN